MPSKTPRQKRAMRAAAHNPEIAKKLDIPVTVAKEFVRADAGTPAPAAAPAPKPKRSNPLVQRGRFY